MPDEVAGSISILADNTINIFTNAGKLIVNIGVGISLNSQTEAAQIFITL